MRVNVLEYFSVGVHNKLKTLSICIAQLILFCGGWAIISGGRCAIGQLQDFTTLIDKSSL